MNFQDTRVFKVHNFKYTNGMFKEMIVEAIAVIQGDYAIHRKMAAHLILKALLTDRFRNFLFEDESLYPFDRNDKRVIEWKNKVLSKGKCEQCGSKKRLEAHHIIKWAEFPQGRIDPENGLCLCHECHTAEHKFDRCYAMMKAN